MADIFALAELNVNSDLIKKWLKKDDDSEFTLLNDKLFATFLNGFIIEHRGTNGDPLRKPESSLNNNIILQKIKIALNLKAEDIIELLEKVEFSLSKPELSAMFRKKDHKHYRECKDQLLRNFLAAIQQQYRTQPVNDKQKKVNTKKYQEKPADEKTVDNKSARVNASKAYINPNLKKPAESKDDNKRKTLKLNPSEIWKNSQ